MKNMPVFVWDQKLTFAVLCLIVSVLLFEVAKHMKETYIDAPTPFRSISARIDTKGAVATEPSMFPFANNKCDLKCCGRSDLSCSGGCVCKTPEQEKMLSTRGYNSTKFSEY